MPSDVSINRVSKDAYSMSDQRQFESDDCHGWAVYQCAHGCVHVRIDDVTLTFERPDFERLVRMLREAQHRLAPSPSQWPLRLQ